MHGTSVTLRDEHGASWLSSLIDACQRSLQSPKCPPSVASLRKEPHVATDTPQQTGANMPMNHDLDKMLLVEEMDELTR